MSHKTKRNPIGSVAPKISLRYSLFTLMTLVTAFAFVVGAASIYFFRPSDLSEVERISMLFLERGVIVEAWQPNPPWQSHWKITFDESTSISPKELGLLEKLDRPLYVDMQRCHIDRQLVNAMANAEIEILDLSVSDVSDGMLRLVAAYANLQSLTLRATSIDGSGFAHLVGLPALQQLVLNSTHLREDALSVLPSFPALTSLHLADVTISDENWHYVGQIWKLKELRAPFSNLPAFVIASLASVSPLEQLDIRECRISPELIEAIRQLESLRELVIAETAIGDDAAISICSLPKLEHIDLSDTKVSDKVLATIAQSESIISADLRNSRVTTAGLSALAGVNRKSPLTLYVSPGIFAGNAGPKLETKQINEHISIVPL
jgi:hypothetical protein